MTRQIILLTLFTLGVAYLVASIMNWDEQRRCETYLSKEECFAIFHP